MHEGLALSIYQARSCAPHRLGDQETSQTVTVEGSGMKLHVLGVDDSRSGSIGHGQPIPPGDGWIGGVEVNLPQPPRSQDGLPGQNGFYLPLLLIEDVGPHARWRRIDIQRVAGMMGRGEQINGRVPGQQSDVGARLQGLDQLLLDGPPCSILDVQDAVGGMSRFPDIF